MILNDFKLSPPQALSISSPTSLDLLKDSFVELVLKFVKKICNLSVS